MSTTPARQPQGQPTGGQFAAQSNPEPEVDLAEPPPPAPVRPRRPRSQTVRFPTGMVNAASFLPGRVQLAPDVWAYEGRAQISERMPTGRAVNLMAQGRLQPREWPPRIRTEVRRTLAVDAEGAVVGGFESEWGHDGGSGWIGDSQSTPARPMSRSDWANRIGRSRPEAEPPTPPAATEEDGLVYCVTCEAWMEPDEAEACHNTFDPPPAQQT